MRIKFEDLKVSSDVLYTETNEWIRVNGNEITIGITDYAQAAMRGMLDDEHLSCIYVLGKFDVNDLVTADDVIGEVESSKNTENIHTSFSGTITAINGELDGDVYYLNQEDVENDPYEKGWLIRIRPNNMDDVKKLMTEKKLMTAGEYELKSAKEYENEFGG
jgi:glycine cleavage system H protein